MKTNIPENTSGRAGYIYPVLLFLTSALPQLILLIVNCYYYSIITGEVTENLRLIRGFFAAEAVLAAFPLIASLCLFVRKRIIHPIIPVLTILLSSAYLAVFLFNYESMIPRFPAWILSEEHICFYQFSLMMPSVIFSIMYLALYKITGDNVKRIGYLALGVIAIPALWFIAFFIIPRSINSPQRFDLMYPAVGCAVLLTAAFYILVFRLAASVFFAVKQKWSGRARAIFCLFFCLGTPLAGLLLNRMIPFPADFQSWQIYALTVINGIALSLPLSRRPSLNKALWLIQLVMFPFSFYFFLVFIPFIPLSIPAIIVMGAGILILTPFILFLIHCKILIDGYRQIFGRTSLKSVLTAAAAVMILPVLISASAVLDRITINSAIEYLYQPDYEHQTSFNGSLSVLKHTLKNIINAKEGSELPFISPAYNLIVFDNLTLPDSKISQLTHTFFAKEPSAFLSDKTGNYFFNTHSWSPAVREASTAAEIQDSTNVLIKNITVTEVKGEKNFLRAVVRIDMRNLTAHSVEEFRARITVSDGLFVSGYKLFIENKPVEGRIFEKKTAFWVYEMIKSTRRDPGILHYTGDNRLLLRVFPFSGGEIRQTEIEFLYPENSSPELTIAGKSVNLPHGEARNTMLKSSDKDAEILFIPSALAAKMKSTERKPDVNIIIDWSKKTSLDAQKIFSGIDRIINEHADAAAFSLTFANYEIYDCAENVPPSQIYAVCTEFMNRNVNGRKGGFAGDRAVRHAIMRRRSDSSFPLIAVITKDASVFAQNSGSLFQRSVPDIDGFYFTDGNALSALSFDGQVLPALPRYNVRAVNEGKTKLFFRADNKDHCVILPSEKSFANGSGNNSAAFTDSQLIEITAAESNKGYAALNGFSENYRKEMFPFRQNLFLQAHALSKQSGVLNGTTSYIVVENASQWRTLEEKEKQKLSGNETLEVQQSPEPPLWLMILFIAGFIAFKKYFSRSKVSC